LDAKWQRQQINQINGAKLVLDNLLLSQSLAFTAEEMKLVAAVSCLLSDKLEAMRKGSPGGG